MKNALILLGTWIGIVLAATMVVYWDGGSDLLPVTVLDDAMAAMTYVHPEGLFSARVPPEWALFEEERGIRVVNAGERVTVWITAIQDPDLEEAVGKAIRAVGAAPGDLAVLDAWPANDMDTEGQVLVATVCEVSGARFTARAQPAGQGAVVMLIRGAEEDVTEAASDLDQMWEDLRVPAEAPLLL